MPVIFTHTSLVSQLVVTQLSLWHPNLDWLSNKIPAPDENPTFEKIAERLEDFIRKVDRNRDSLRSKGEEGVNAGIRIAQEVDMILASMVPFQKTPSSLYP